MKVSDEIVARRRQAISEVSQCEINRVQHAIGNYFQGGSADMTGEKLAAVSRVMADVLVRIQDGKQDGGML